MSNGDTIAEILEFIENDGADMPKAVTNKMLAVVLREQHHNMKDTLHGLENKIDNLVLTAGKNSERIGVLEQERAVSLARIEERGIIDKEAMERTEKKFDRKIRSIEAYGLKELLTGALGGLAVFVVSKLPVFWDWLVALFK